MDSVVCIVSIEVRGEKVSNGELYFAIENEYAQGKGVGQTAQIQVHGGVHQ